MSYTDKDRSIHDGEPIEVFKFIMPGKTLRYTSSAKEQTVNSEVYEPLPGLERGPIEISNNIANARTVDIQVPFDSELAIDCGYLNTPEELEVEIRRVYEGTNFNIDAKVIWMGEAVGYGVSGRVFAISTGSLIHGDLAAGMNSVYYQSICNHVLYDERCKASKAAHTTSSTVVAIGPDSIEVLNDGVADGALSVGELTNARTGERRLIINNQANVLNIGYPFIDIVVGDTVNMSKGCDHSFDGDCLQKFDNQINYGGFLYIPTKNPFETGEI